MINKEMLSELATTLADSTKEYVEAQIKELAKQNWDLAGRIRDLESRLAQVEKRITDGDTAKAQRTHFTKSGVENWLD